MKQRFSILAAIGLAASAGGAAAPDDTFVYVSVEREKRIAVYRADASGTLAHRSDISLEGEPGPLITDPRRRFLFASMRSIGKLAAFRIDPATGGLTHVNTVPAGANPAHLSTDRRGRFLLCAYYDAGKVTVHAIGRDGALSAEPRQSSPTAEKAHAIVLDRQDRFAFVPHTGPNAIFQFVFNRETGKLEPAAVPKLETPHNTGPRHLVFHPSQDTAYVSNEQGGSVTVYRLDRKAKTLRPVQTLSTLPAGFAGSNACSEIRIHPTGRFVYVANRGHDSIACFRVTPDGSLAAIGQAPTEQTPRSFDIDPSGKFLYAAGESSGKLAAYRIDGATGELERFATWDAGKGPWWVLAVRLGTAR